MLRLRDLLDPERATATLLKVATCLILFCVVLELALCALRQISPTEEFLILSVFLLLSPLAYLIRQPRRGLPLRLRTTRGAERTPLLPQNEEDFNE